MDYTLAQYELAYNFVTAEEDKTQLLSKEAFWALVNDDTPTNPNSDDKQTINGVTINCGQRYRFLINNDYEINQTNLTDNGLKANG